jgi:hypothetical protein
MRTIKVSYSYENITKWERFLVICIVFFWEIIFNFIIILAIHRDLHLYFTSMVKMQIQLFAVSFSFEWKSFLIWFYLDMDGRYVGDGFDFMYGVYI